MIITVKVQSRLDLILCLLFIQNYIPDPCHRFMALIPYHTIHYIVKPEFYSFDFYGKGLNYIPDPFATGVWL